jgi:inorganic pyrophosphatase
MEDEQFWVRLDEFVASHHIRVDRPKGLSYTEEPDLVYPLDYGFLEGTLSGDGAEVDVWVGSLSGGTVTGLLVTVDEKKHDAELKVLVGCTGEEARQVLAIHNRGMQSAILVQRAT